ncbi:class I SAM-dependent methyltransferase [Microbacterium sp. 2FI]|uniref:class I SAM-dependent methyltransferase n=1 Tax=Microbacterium sp. 2FI TaxID=2502193 RepID=UPI001484C813|nr:class I SAM-dependent methyltransferase [Microbacterium sp. 2FI]
MTDADLAATFLSIGAEYERSRPGFPVEIAAAVAPDRVKRVLDLGAGTGKLTERLISRADEVIAVEPSEPMLAQLRRKLPQVRALIGTAEAIPLPDAVCDLVTVAQAYHWFEPEAASREIRRVLAPDGRLALIWNGPDPRCAWDSDAHRIAHPAEDDDDADAQALPVLDVPGFTQVGSIRVSWIEEISRRTYLDRWLTVSTFLAATERARTTMIGQVEAVLDAHPDTCQKDTLQLPHVTDALVYEAGT